MLQISLKSLCGAFWKVSDWIDNKVFPMPDERLAFEKADKRFKDVKADNAAKFLSKSIKTCTSLKHAYAVRGMVDNLANVHGKTERVLRWQRILRMRLNQKEMQIIQMN